MKNMITKETQQIAIGMPVELQRVGNCAAFKEMLSILLAALLIEENADMTVLTDAKVISIVYNGTKQIFKSKNINALWQLFIRVIEEEKKINLSMQFIPGSENPADRPSRLRHLDQWGYRYVEKTFAATGNETILRAKDILVGAGMYDTVLHATQGYTIMEEPIRPPSWRS